MITCGHLPEPVLQRILLQNFSTAWRRTAHELDVLASTRISRFRTTPDKSLLPLDAPGLRRRDRRMRLYPALDHVVLGTVLGLVRRLLEGPVVVATLCQ